MTNENEWVRYDHIPILETNPKLRRMLLGKRLSWTIKEDGQNVIIWTRKKKYCKKKTEVVISSHNQEIAAADIQGYVRRCPQYETILQVLKDYPLYRMVCEECAKGPSITGIKTYTEDILYVVDIYNVAEHKYLPYTQVYQLCYHYHLPIVQLYATTRHRTIKNLVKFANHVLEYCNTPKDYGKDEGMVAKTFGDDDEYIMAKVKLDIPRPIVERIREGPVLLQQIPDGEIMGAISHVEADSGLDGTPVHDMPLIAKAVAEECKRHLYSSKANLFGYYKKYMENRKQ